MKQKNRQISTMNNKFTKCYSQSNHTFIKLCTRVHCVFMQHEILATKMVFYICSKKLFPPQCNAWINALFEMRWKWQCAENSFHDFFSNACLSNTVPLLVYKRTTPVKLFPFVWWRRVKLTSKHFIRTFWFQTRGKTSLGGTIRIITRFLLKRAKRQCSGGK